MAAPTESQARISHAAEYTQLALAVLAGLGTLLAGQLSGSDVIPCLILALGEVFIVAVGSCTGSNLLPALCAITFSFWPQIVRTLTRWLA